MWKVLEGLVSKDMDTKLPRALKILHFAPELCLERRLRAMGGVDYVTTDYLLGSTDLQLDITDINLDNDSVGGVICAHVLEHIVEDRIALAEIRRVLRPDGWALLVVPVDPTRTHTYEDASVVAPADRLREFGQVDHVRWYARQSFEERVLEAGLEITRISHDDYPDADRLVLERSMGPNDCIVLGRAPL